MLEITNLVTPSPEQFEIVIKGMRLPFKSGNKSDSTFCEGQYFGYCGQEDCQFWSMGNDGRDASCGKPKEEKGRITLGEKDKQLLLNLCSAGDPSHRKVLRQLPIIMDIKAPLYWWKQMDKYQVGTVTNAESTMHTLVKKEFEMSDFSLEFSSNNHSGIPDFEFVEMFLNDGSSLTLGKCFRNYLLVLNKLRDTYLETEDIRFWHLINKLLPQSYNQTRCWSGNYENLVTILKQRKGHKLSEWEQFRTYVLNNVPYLKEINEAVNESNN